MQTNVAHIARDSLARSLGAGVQPQELELDFDLAREYGLTSLNKVLFLTSLCDETGVDLSTFTEIDVARMRSLRDVIEAYAPHVQTVT